MVSFGNIEQSVLFMNFRYFFLWKRVLNFCQGVVRNIFLQRKGDIRLSQGMETRLMRRDRRNENMNLSWLISQSSLDFLLAPWEEKSPFSQHSCQPIVRIHEQVLMQSTCWWQAFHLKYGSMSLSGSGSVYCPQLELLTWDFWFHAWLFPCFD